MKRLVTIGLFFLLAKDARAQQTATEQQLEALSEVLEAEIEDDTYLQQLAYFQRHALNINKATPEDLQLFRMLTPLQVQSFMTYRNALGPLIDLHELQAVPHWDIVTIRRMLPYLTLQAENNVAFKKQLTTGDALFLARYSRVLQQQRGYLEGAGSRYAGDPSKLLLRYKYQYKNSLQYGITAEKDAGESAFKTSQNPFDFLSFHFYARSQGLVKAIAIGDYTINLGKGLVQWQSLAFKKSSEVTGIVRQSAVVRPYSGAGEFYFNRGAAVTLQKGAWQATVFASSRRLSANAAVDSSGARYITSFNTSGLHRTRSELEDRKNVNQQSFGGNITYASGKLKVGLNAVQQYFSKPIIKRAELYNLFAISGKSWTNASLDYTYTYKNVFLFGEAALDQKGSKAFLQGALASVHPKADVALLYRHISPSYQSLYGNAFTEGALPTNEKGFYAGIAIRPNPAWRLQAYADHYTFPWVRARADAPGSGKDYMVQATYTPNKIAEAYIRFRSESKPANQAESNSVMNAVLPIPRQSVRLHYARQFNRQLGFRSRAEKVWYNTITKREPGFLLYAEGVYKSATKSTASLRLQYFNTSGFNSRIYVYESDVLYGYSIPFFYGKGLRAYGNFSYQVSEKCTAWLRWAETVYTDRTAIGSGLEQIKGRRRTEAKLQLRWLF